MIHGWDQFAQRAQDHRPDRNHNRTRMAGLRKPLSDETTCSLVRKCFKTGRPVAVPGLLVPPYFFPESPELGLLSLFDSDFDSDLVLDFESPLESPFESPPDCALVSASADFL